VTNTNWKTKYRLEREQGTVFKDWGGRLPVALIYPNSYFVGMSNLGMHTIYRLLNDDPTVVCERVFMPDAKTGGEAISLESGRPLSDFAALAFSVSFELDYFNLAEMLRLGGLPLYAADRDERHPLIIGGGPCLSANPEPLAPFLDCIGIGEAEALLPPLIPLLWEMPDNRSGLLAEIAELPGFYVPQVKGQAPVKRQYLKNLDDFRASSAVMTRDTELGDLYLMEVERGCGWGCRFCLAGQIFRPPRFRSVAKLLAEAEAGLGCRRRVGLVGAAVSDHPRIEEIVSGLRDMGAQIAISSLRVNPLSPAVLEAVLQSGAKTLAVAPEAGSERLREMVNKHVNEDDILRAATMLSGSRLTNIKLYYMIGLPTETEWDIDETIRLTLAFRETLERGGSKARLSLNVAPFVPKAATPFQWLPMAPPEIIQAHLAKLKAGLSARGIKVKAESPPWSEVQAVLARGDQKLASVIAAAWPLRLASWRQSMDEAGLDIDSYIYRRIAPGEVLPWSVVDGGAPVSRLYKELESAFTD
jgi:radical SAM superfamily enzyme YgiQ (UPF0313 family)